MDIPALQSEQQRPRQTLAWNGFVGPVDEVSPSPCHQVDGDNSKDGDISGYSIPHLPEDIWRHIHSLMPMDAAARAACVSHAFLTFWRCYPELTLSRQMLCSKADVENLSSRINSILRNHAGIGLKIVKLSLCNEYSSFPCISSWLQVVVTPGIEELALTLYKGYKFPCSLLSNGVRNSIRSLQLGFCVFHPTHELGPLRSLTRLTLRRVRITGDELECLLSNSLALEHLDLTECKDIISLKTPSVLLQLRCLSILGCYNLKFIENHAPSLSSFTLFGNFSKLSLGEASQMMKVVTLRHSHVVRYARSKLPLIMPNLERLELGSGAEVDTPMVHTKFLNLKHLVIQISGVISYDYFSLVSFLVASPSLETWYLDVYEEDIEHESVFGGSSHLRQLPEHNHDHLKSVEVVGFNSAKGLVELTVCIVKSAVSLEQLTLDTLHGYGRCSWKNNNDCSDDICSTFSDAMLEKASRGVAAIRKYIEDKVPPTAKLTVLEPCPRCHMTPVDST